MQARALVVDLGRLLSIDLAPDNAGHCALRISVTVVVVAVSEDGKTLSFEAMIADACEHDFRAALEANHSGDFGATFVSLDPVETAFIAREVIAAERVTSDDLNIALCRFVDRVAALRAHFVDGDTLAAVSEDRDTAGEVVLMRV
ncbi:CesT family type III secretion system chaperone [Roseibium sp.]|uniref:CesT family type III secretion system chaperone n=1 Tax=Roseibium sp. TaxID=1936156 RepID=UPI003262F734